ncbi:MAG: penicillin-binding protein 1C, partial [Rhodobacterales bacterium]|nr:penicillin-binding protein 1C [Rhodobacterales bacterium]
RSWFVLPTSQAWFYDRNHADYHPLPPWDPSCEGQEDTGELALLRPRNGAEVYVPVELNGQRGRVVFEAAHRDDRAQVHWHLDGEFVETTELIHQIALAPAAGAHELTVVDQEGVTARRRFTVLDKKASLVRTVADRLSD